MRLGAWLIRAIATLALATAMVACGKDKDGARGPTGAAGIDDVAGAAGTDSTGGDAAAGGDVGTGGNGGEGGDGGDGEIAGTAGIAGTGGTGGGGGGAGSPGPQGGGSTTGPMGPTGPQGDPGEPGVSTADVSGTVTGGGMPLPGAAVAFDPAVVEALTTDASGEFEVADLPIGTYLVTVSATGYATTTAELRVVAGVAATLNLSLLPVDAVVVSAGSDATGLPGDAVTLLATATAYDGSTGTTFSWQQISGLELAISGTATATPTVTLASRAEYKAAVVAAVAAPDRFIAMGVNPFAIEQAAVAVFEVTATTSSGAYTDAVQIVADIGIDVSTGLRSVPVGVPFLLQAREAASYAWTVSGTGGPTLVDADTRWPIFSPPGQGTYTITETVSGSTMTISAGKWVGAIDGVGVDGRPESSACRSCHSGDIAPEHFSAWRASGHAEIFSQNIDNPSHHWSTGCASCHAVGYNVRATADNEGFDDVAAEEGWTVPAGAPGNYAAMFVSTSKTAARGNVQCENCHGPNTAGHATSNGTEDPRRRISYAAEVCGTCHGEPLRHGRYQQWQQSLHADTDLAIEEASIEHRADGGANHCGRCHSAQGFVAWIEQGENLSHNLYAPGTTTAATDADMAALGMTEGEVQPITCAACHDPHGQGTVSGDANTATVRVSGSTGDLPGGFRATSVGSGALCITCHNTRNGAHNDGVTVASVGAPHHSSQGDVLMGENAYFVTPGVRGAHSYIENTCSNCHLQLTDPPAEFSYERSGTNHSFAADMAVCANCHGAFEGSNLQVANAEALASVLDAITDASLQRMNAAAFYVRAQDPTTSLWSSATNNDATVLVDTATNPVTAVTVTLGRTITFDITTTSALTFTASDGTTLVTTDVIRAEQRGIKIDDGTVPGTAGTQLFLASGTLAKAAWNHMLLDYDGSLGVHNPRLFSEVVQATKLALSDPANVD